MKQFNKVQTISSRVKATIESDIASRSKQWLIGLGYADCNDYAQSVVNRVSYTASGIEHVRFETVARYVRTAKSKLRAELAAEAATAQTETQS